MVALIFIDLQGFIIKDKFVAKEIAILKDANELTRYVYISAANTLE